MPIYDPPLIDGKCHFCGRTDCARAIEEGRLTWGCTGMLINRVEVAIDALEGLLNLTHKTELTAWEKARQVVADHKRRGGAI